MGQKKDVGELSALVEKEVYCFARQKQTLASLLNKIRPLI